VLGHTAPVKAGGSDQPSEGESGEHAGLRGEGGTARANCRGGSYEGVAMSVIPKGPARAALVRCIKMGIMNGF
jgi:hypothetical protein